MTVTKILINEDIYVCSEIIVMFNFEPSPIYLIHSFCYPHLLDEDEDSFKSIPYPIMYNCLL